MFKTIYNAGGEPFSCSNGMPSENSNTYSFRVAKDFGADVVSLSRPGSCNFVVSLMIDWFVNNVDDRGFYVITTTQEDRISWIDPRDDCLIDDLSIEDLNYEDYQENLLTKLPFTSSNLLQSETHHNVLMFQHRRGLNKALRKTTPPIIDSLSAYIKESYNSKLKRRQDVGSLATQCYRLNQLTPYWVMLTDWPELLDMFPGNTINKAVSTSEASADHEKIQSKINDWLKRSQYV